MSTDTSEPRTHDPEGAILVLLADARTVMREGLAALIQREPDIAVVGQIATAADAARLVDLDPHVVVTEINLPDRRGADVIAALRARFARSAILVLTMTDYPTRVQETLSAGANGYVLKTATADELLHGIRAVASGDTYLQPKLGVALARWHDPRADNDPVLGWARLSPKETQVLRLIALGHTNAEVARTIGVSLRTAETHRAAIQRKVGVRTRAELVRYAHRAGLVDLDEQ